MSIRDMKPGDTEEVMNGTAVLTVGKDGKTTVLTIKEGFLPLKSMN